MDCWCSKTDPYTRRVCKAVSSQEREWASFLPALESLRAKEGEARTEERASAIEREVLSAIKGELQNSRRPVRGVTIDGSPAPRASRIERPKGSEKEEETNAEARGY